LNYLPSKLSGGEKQRVAIARAMVNHPKFILADEPTGNLDTETTQNIIELLHEINNDGSTIIMVTHDKDATKNTRLLRIKDGIIEIIKN
jgi:putative ABC transport system ATP-binding protein